MTLPNLSHHSQTERNPINFPLNKYQLSVIYRHPQQPCLLTLRLGAREAVSGQLTTTTIAPAQRLEAPVPGVSWIGTMG